MRIPSSDLLDKMVAPEPSASGASARTYKLMATLIFLASVSIALFFIGAGLAFIDAPSWVKPLGNYMMLPGTIVIGLGIGALVGGAGISNRGSQYWQ